MNGILFNGKQDMWSSPRTLSGHQVFEQVKDIEVIFGKREVKEKLVKRIRVEQPIDRIVATCHFSCRDTP